MFRLSVEFQREVGNAPAPDTNEVRAVYKLAIEFAFCLRSAGSLGGSPR